MLLQESSFIRRVMLLKGLGKARGEEEEKENIMEKMKGRPKQKVGRCYQGSEILSEPWTFLCGKLQAA